MTEPSVYLSTSRPGSLAWRPLFVATSGDGRIGIMMYNDALSAM